MIKHFLLLLSLNLCLTANYAQNVDWAKKYGITYNDIATDVTTDYEGNVCLVGRCGYGVEFDTDTLIGPCNYIAKLDALGNEIWVKLIPNPNYGWTWSNVEVDSDNNVYLYDKLSTDTLVIDQDTLYATDGKFFIAKFDPSGTLVWSKAICKTTSTNGNYLRIGDLDISPNDELHLNGSFADTTIFDQDTLFMENGRAFVAKYDIDGNYLMSTQFGAWNQSILIDGYGIAADDQGCTYVSGRSEFGGLYDGDTVWTQQYFSEMFIVKFSPSGDMLWHKHATGINPGTGGAADEVCTFGLDWNNNDGVILTGYYNSDIYFGDSTIIHPYSKLYWSGFVAKYDTTGNFEWVKHEDKFYFFEVDCDLDGNVYLAGLYRDSINFWGDIHQAPYLSLDGIAARLDSNGTVDWSVVAGGAVGWSQISVDKCSSHKVYFAGDYSNYPLPIGGINLPSPTQGDIFIAGIQNDSLGNGCSGIGFSEEENPNTILIYPNPTTSEFFIDLTDDLDQLTLFDLAGRSLLQMSNISEGLQIIDVSSLPNGMYIIQMVKDDQMMSTRIVKQ